MNQVQDITKHVKGKHLNFAQRAIIRVRLQDGWSPYRIAKELGCCANTIRNEIKQGTPGLYWGNTSKYAAVHAHAIYEGHRMNSHRTPNIQAVKRFLKAVEARFKDEHWSLDACVGYFRAAHEFAAKEMVCTKTLYNYVDRGILKIKNIDLPQKLRRKPRKDTPRQFVQAGKSMATVSKNVPPVLLPVNASATGNSIWSSVQTMEKTMCL